MDQRALEILLKQVQSGKLSVQQALTTLKHLPYEKIGPILFDHHRALRSGLPEIVYGPGKTREQLLELSKTLVSRGTGLVVTRVSHEDGTFLEESVPELEYDEVSRCLFYCPERLEEGKIEQGVLILTAGTSDLPVAKEAALCLKVMKVYHELVVDIGVAGIHRLFDCLDTIFDAGVIIVVAGMEGALPSVVAGIATAPVIAVPTSTGYGSNLDGLVPLFAMLNSCAPGIGVVNIDNGVGAALLAVSILKRIERAVSPSQNL